jgi:2-oxoglutarate ferredoxin oxidoreductase subunit alpha
VIYYGSTAPAMQESLAHLEEQGLAVDAMRVRAFPFCDEVYDFVAGHEHVFVVEQNRDAQLRTLLINEGEIDPARLIKVLNFDGAPITARFITDRIAGLMAPSQREAAE